MRELRDAGFTEKQAEAVMKKITRLRRQDLLMLGSLLVLLIGAVFYLSTVFTSNVNEASIKNCEDTNRTTAAQIQTLNRGIEVTEGDIRETRTTDYSTLFPNLPPEQLQEIIDDQVRELRAQNADRRSDRDTLVIVDCEQRFP